MVERIGTYRVEGVLGRGGMGDVFLARDDKLQRRVAIKRIRPEHSADPGRRARFRREALAVARLSHPAIVQVYELLETEEGDCLVMERVDGRSLAAHIAAGDLDLRRILRLAAEIADGLADAHAHGLIHRDLKPENVLVSCAGHAKIVDFGLARMLWNDGDPDGSLAGGTEAGMLVGTVHAMSPEQAGGGEVDHRSDLFALGSLLYEMLTGRAPFRGDNWLDTLRRVNGETPPPLERLRPGLPPALGELTFRLLEKDREKRPANARLVAAALEAIVAAGGFAELPPRPSAVPGSPPSGSPPPAGPRVALAAQADLATGEWPVAAERAASRGVSVVRTLLRVEGAADQRRRPLPPGLAGRALQLLRDLVARHGGAEVEKGEALLALFERPADAVACALEHQRELSRLAGGEPAAPAARAAIHLGEVLLIRPSAVELGRGARPLEVEGPAKELVARLAALTGGHQVLLTRGAFDLARQAIGRLSGEGAARPVEDEEPGGWRWLAHGAFALAGLEEPLELFEVGRVGFSLLTPPADSPAARRLLSASEERLLGWRPAAGQAIPLRPLWRLEERLGEGGFGEVWRARHKAGEQWVFKFCFEATKLRALKREVTLFRLLKEALGHRDDIARILDWQFDEPPYFVESELTDGGSLARWAGRGEPLAARPLALRLELVAQVAEALAAAHSVGVLHKDVKPENVLVAEDREGRPRALLADFGIGLLTESGRLEQAGVTRLGFTATLEGGAAGAGSFTYLAPELVEGKAPSIQADIYSLGVVAYQLVVGDLQRPLAPGWERDVADELLAEELARLVDGRPERRPASAREVAESLRTLETRRELRRAAAAREEAFRRAQRRRRLASGAAAVALGVLAIVSVMALREYQAREAAETAERRAALRQKQAEELIDFMLGDLRQRLGGVGRLDVLDAVGEQAMAYFAAVPAAELSETELTRRSRALYQIGEVRVNQGRLPAARVAFAEAVRLAEALTARDGSDDDAFFELAQGRFWLGNVDWSQGQAAPARANFGAYLDIAEARAARDPASTRWKLEVAYALTSLAAVEEKTGDRPAAARDLRRAIAIKQELVASAPEHREWRTSLANGLAWLAAMRTAEGRLEEPVAAFEEELRLREALSGEAPLDSAARAALATCLGNLSQALLNQGRLEEARAALERELGLVEGLTAADPANRDWQRDLAVAIFQLAEARFFAGADGAGIEQLLQRSERILAQLLAADPTNRAWRLEKASIAIKAAGLRLRGGAVAEALETARRAGAEIRALRAEEPDRRVEILLDATFDLVLGKALAAAGRVREARQAWQRARLGLEPVMVDQAGLRFRHAWAEILLRLGRQDAAAEIARLRAAGYARPDFRELSAFGAEAR